MPLQGLDEVSPTWKPSGRAHPGTEEQGEVAGTSTLSQLDRSLLEPFPEGRRDLASGVLRRGIDRWLWRNQSDVEAETLSG